MKYRPGILFLLFSLLAAMPTSQAWACGSDDAGHAAKFHHEYDAVAHKYATEAVHHHHDGAEEGAPAHADASSPNEDDCGHCHCPGCGMASHAGGPCIPATSAVSFASFSGLLQKQAFYFARHLPEAVYLPIWQPPKLGV